MTRDLLSMKKLCPEIR